MCLSVLVNWGFLYQKLYEDHQFYQSLTDLCSVSLICLFFFLHLSPQHQVAYRIPQLCCVTEGVVFSLELVGWLHWLCAVAFPSEEVKYCIIEKTKKIALSYQHEKFGTLLLSSCDWRCLFSPRQLAFITRRADSVWDLPIALLRDSLGLSTQSSSTVVVRIK